MSETSPKSSSPDKLVVLTFDDGAKSMVTFVAPLLKRLGFGATFYITDDPGFRGEHYLNWTEVKQLSDEGFKIGNHLACHVNVAEESRAAFVENVELLEQRCQEYAIPRPVTLCYPGYHTSLDVVRILEELDYLCCRHAEPRMVRGPDIASCGSVRPHKAENAAQSNRSAM